MAPDRLYRSILKKILQIFLFFKRLKLFFNRLKFIFNHPFAKSLAGIAVFEQPHYFLEEVFEV